MQTIGRSQQRWQYRRKGTSRSNMEVRSGLPPDASVLWLHDHREDQARAEPAIGRTERPRGAVAGQPECLAVLKLHYLRWVLFDIGRNLLHVPGNLRHRFRQVHRRRDGTLLERRHQHSIQEPRRISGRLEDERSGVHRVLSRSPVPSFLEYGEYPYVSADEIKKALKLKAAFSKMLDQMQ